MDSCSTKGFLSHRNLSIKTVSQEFTNIDDTLLENTHVIRKDVNKCLYV